MADDNDREQGAEWETPALPAEHSPRPWGIGVGTVGAALIAGSYLYAGDGAVVGSSYYPGGDALALERIIAIKAFLSFGGDRLIAAGFLMWLASRVIDAFRHPKFY